jgi:mono/diheme cytochrome c family protein
MKTFALTLTLMLVACGGSPTRVEQVLALTGVASSGQTVYTMRGCAGCHGAAGKGVPSSGTPLASSVAQGSPFLTAVINGKGSSMPSFSSLPNQDLADLLAWAKANIK